ncbi:MAG: 23S rRNA (guanosine(2251)-2'-O)-methyltransferase RlmB [Anaerolineales bacterium]|jgi:23S rRNA (guanosine2251-2'-O)-methyltransferase
MAVDGLERIYGRNPVNEVLLAGRRQVRKLLVAQGARERDTLGEAIALARAASVPIERVARQELDRLNVNHQGVVAEATAYPYVTISEVQDRALAGREPPLVLLLDLLQDPQNLGVLLRTAEATGVHGVVIPQRRSVGVTPAVVSASAGASEHLWVARANLAHAMRALKAAGLWMFGLEVSERAKPVQDLDLQGGIGLVVGSEGEGLRRLVAQSCDWLVRLPMRGRIESLNASVAGSIMLYEIWRARGYAAGEPAAE